MFNMFWNIGGVVQRCRKDLLQLALSCFGKFLLLLYGHLPILCSMALVVPTEMAKQFSWLSIESFSKALASFPPSWSWCAEVSLIGLLLGSRLLGLTLLPLRLTMLIFVLAWIMNASDMFWMEPSSEAPGHLRVPLGLFPSLVKIIIRLDIFICLLKQVL
jgi:hypothetical protein